MSRKAITAVFYGPAGRGNLKIDKNMPDFTNFYPWKDLIVNAGSFHIKRIGNSLWLFLYLAFEADPVTHLLRRKYEDISQQMSVKKRTIRCWLKRLKDYDYVSIRREKTGLLIKVNGNFLPSDKNESGKNVPQGAAEFCPSQKPLRPRKAVYSKEKKPLADKDNANVNGNAKKLNNVNGASKQENGEKYGLDDNFEPSTREELLALDLAKGLEDTDNFAFYLSVSQQYPEAVLREIWHEVRETSRDKIKRSRGALFCYLVKKRLALKSNPA